MTFVCLLGQSLLKWVQSPYVKYLYLFIFLKQQPLFQLTFVFFEFLLLLLEAPVRQTQINEKVPDEIQEIKIAIQWVREQSIDLQKQALLKCDWNSIQFYITTVWFNYNAYNWEQIRFHLQDLHDNAFLNMQSAFSKSTFFQQSGNFS